LFLQRSSNINGNANQIAAGWLDVLSMILQRSCGALVGILFFLKLTLVVGCSWLVTKHDRSLFFLSKEVTPLENVAALLAKHTQPFVNDKTSKNSNRHLGQTHIFERGSLSLAKKYTPSSPDKRSLTRHFALEFFPSATCGFVPGPGCSAPLGPCSGPFFLQPLKRQQLLCRPCKFYLLARVRFV